MNHHNHRKPFANSARAAVALCALAALGGRAAQAQFSMVTSPSQLGNTTLTNQYPLPNNGIVGPSFNVGTMNGLDNLVFTATNAVQPSANSFGGGFQAFMVSSTNSAPQFSMAPFGTAGDVAEDLTFASTSGNIATGPLEIQFQNAAGVPTGVAGFGLLAQDFNIDMETFTVNIFSDPNATVPLGSFTYNTVDNTQGSGQAVFVGAQSTQGLPLIESATISSFSVATGINPNNGNNAFAFGRTFVSAPVPEASTVVSFGMGVLLFAGLALGAHKRKANGTTRDASQTIG